MRCLNRCAKFFGTLGRLLAVVARGCDGNLQCLSITGRRLYDRTPAWQLAVLAGSSVLWSLAALFFEISVVPDFSPALAGLKTQCCSLNALMGRTNIVAGPAEAEQSTRYKGFYLRTRRCWFEGNSSTEWLGWLAGASPTPFGASVPQAGRSRVGRRQRRAGSGSRKVYWAVRENSGKRQLRRLERRWPSWIHGAEDNLPAAVWEEDRRG